MEIGKFQERLRELCEMAKREGGELSQEQVREHFEGANLTEEQLLKVQRYLKLQGISLLGAPEQEEKELPEKAEGTRVPLTPQEKAYLDEYLASVKESDSAKEETEELFVSLAKGDSLAMAKLSQRYLPAAAMMAADLNCEEIHLADLIQEANVSLLTALEEAGSKVKNDLWLRMEIKKGILQAIQEQTRQSLQDEALVARVEKLEAAVKELTDEDGENRFTVDELAVILDMSVEEIRDILRLTGDDK